MISVYCISHNQARFIRQAVDSFLDQNCSYPFHIYIGDDNSIDGTAEVLLSYQERFPDKITVLTSDKHLGMMENCRRTLSVCDGEYIALCDGDDYWTDKNKLQKQADFLESNPDYNIAFHQVTVLDGKKRRDYNGDFNNYPVRKHYTQEDIFRGKPIQTSSAMIRRIQLPEWFTSVECSDRAIWALASQDKKIHFMRESMAVYRITGTGVWTGLNKEQQELRNKTNLEKLKMYMGVHNGSILNNTP